MAYSRSRNIYNFNRKYKGLLYHSLKSGFIFVSFVILGAFLMFQALSYGYDHFKWHSGPSIDAEILYSSEAPHEGKY